MHEDNYFQLGYVLKTHGLKGGLIFKLDVDFPENYHTLKKVYIKVKKQDLSSFYIKSIHIVSSRAIVQLKGVKNIKRAQIFKRATLYLPLDQLPELEENQFYYHEVIGFSIKDEKKGILGTINNFYTDVLSFIAMKYRKKEILIPVHEHIIKKVDRKAKTLTVVLPEGLLEIE